MDETPHTIAKLLCTEYSGNNLNEADTRHQIIDRIIHDILCWPRNRVSCEEYISPGYADYVFRKGSGDVVLLVEAKKEGQYFNIPDKFSNNNNSRRVRLSELLTDCNLNKAINQVREYCLINPAII